MSIFGAIIEVSNMVGRGVTKYELEGITYLDVFIRGFCIEDQLLSIKGT